MGRLAQALAELESLSDKLASGEYRGNEEDSIVVLKISAIYFRSTPGLMQVTTEAMDKLEPNEVAEAARLTAEFREVVGGLEQGCRDRSLARQKESCAAASRVLAEYLKLAAVHYTVPTVMLR